MSFEKLTVTMISYRIKYLLELFSFLEFITKSGQASTDFCPHIFCLEKPWRLLRWEYHSTLKTTKKKRGTRLDRRQKARCETKYSRVARVFCVVTLSANEIRLRKETRAVAAETAGFSSYLDSTMGHHRDVSRAVISWLSPWRQSLRNGRILVTYGVPDGKICVRPSIRFAGFRDIHCISIAVV